MAQTHTEGLDGLRGVSALVVVFAHAAVLPLAGSHPLPMLGLGMAARAAVLVFFVLSGHVIVRSIMTMVAAGGFSPLVYAVNRASRVYPPFLLSVALAWCAALLRVNDIIPAQPLLMAEPLNTSLGALARDIAFLFGGGTPAQNANAPLWSLRIEVVCYVVAGLVAASLSAGMALRTALIAAACCLAVLAALRLTDAFIGMAAFAAGGLTALRPFRLPGWLPGGLCAIAAGFAALAVGQAAQLEVPGVAGSPAYLGFQVAAILAAAAAILQIVGEPGAAAARITALFQPLAPFSYTLFITHMPLLILIGGWIPGGLAIGGGLAAAAAVTLLLAALAFAFALIVERQAGIRRWSLARLGIARSAA